MASSRDPTTPQTVHVRVRSDVRSHVKRGHPWVYRRGLVRDAKDGRAGDVAVVHDEKGAQLAVGLYDPASEIAVRVLAAGKPVVVDGAFIEARIAASFARRAPIVSPRDDEGPLTDGLRLVFGESDGLPGLVVDRYASIAVVKLYSACWFPWLDDVVRAVRAPFAPLGAPTRVVLRLARNVVDERAPARTDGEALVGDALFRDEAPHTFRENGMRFLVDPVRGQKTGFFLDQRDNRARVRARADVARVLNVFSYSGGFSLAAAFGGAREVTSVDLARPALDDAVRNFALNARDPQVARARHTTIAGDAFLVLQDLARAGARFELVVLDPPAFTRRREQLDAARESYARLAALGLAVVEKRGTLVFASCSAHVTADDLLACLHEGASRARRAVRVEEVTGHAPDHPIAFAEGAYLKCSFVDVD